jgi:ubiquinone/menaquinone biosynthesis C-methylase UbiE
MSNEENVLPSPAVLLNFITGFWSSRAVYIIAKLGIPDLLTDGAKSAEELASATDTHAPALYRILRALTSLGILNSPGENKFSLTPVSELLVTNAPGSMRWFIVSELGEEHYPAWGNLMHSVKTGEIAFDNHFGKDIWAYFKENPEMGALFYDSMSGMTRIANESIMEAYDFSPFKKVVDVGGGHGALLTSILKGTPEASGILFDSEEVTSGARPKIEEAGIANRCEVVAGNFFEAVPAGGDVYVMKWIIHDWNDELSITILKNIRKQISPNGRVIIFDTVVPDTNEPDFSKFFDLNMLVMTGGKERTAKEFEVLLNASGFRLVRIIPTETPTAIIEGEPV